MDQNFMKEKKILPLVISMSLPMVVSMATNSLYNIVDSYFVAKISEDAMTAISLVYPIQNLMTAIGVGFGVGLNAKIAYFLGAGAKEQADKAASTGMLLSLIHGIVLMVICFLGMPWFLSLFFEFGSKDSHLVCQKSIKKYYPGAKIITRKGYGHCEYMFTHSDQYAELLKSYMEEK